MIRIASIAAAIFVFSVPAFAQETAPQAAPRTPDSLRLPLIEGVTAAPDCGGLFDLPGRVQCMTAPLGQVGQAAEVYAEALLQTGWAGAGGGPNQILFQRPSEAGCDVLEMITFYDFNLPEDQLGEAPGYIGLALNLDAPCIEAQDNETPEQ